MEWLGRLGSKDNAGAVLKLHQDLSKVTQQLTNRIANPSARQVEIEELPFEILPPGLWGVDALLSHLKGRGWPVAKLETWRLDHLFSLEPRRVYLGRMRREYRYYLAFLFGDGMPVLLESPFHGNATYVIREDWRHLCQRTKRELRSHPDAESIEHRNMDSWKWAICDVLEKPMPGHSNEY